MSPMRLELILCHKNEVDIECNEKGAAHMWEGDADGSCGVGCRIDYTAV
jgi:hypothetical protein